jgi:cytosine/adenosine deaminase-related metal-dependent hydrolase
VRILQKKDGSLQEIGSMPARENSGRTLLVRHAEQLVTMDERRTILRDAGLFAVGGVIRQVGPSASLPHEADEVIDARGMVVLPGLVNTHHHLFQGLTRCVPAAQNLDLYNWLVALYPVWKGVTRADCAAAARLCSPRS